MPKKMKKPVEEPQWDEPVAEVAVKEEPEESEDEEDEDGW